MTWAMQAAVVLAVPLSLLGLSWAGARAVRMAKGGGGGRRESAAMMAGLYVDSLPGIREFKCWLADLIDGDDSSGGSSSSAYSADSGSAAESDGDASDASPGDND